MTKPGETTVFVVDDDDSVRKGLTRLLSSAGYRVDAFRSAKEFLARGTPRPDGPACVILDLCMPDLGGLELQDLLQAANVPLPILFATGHGDVPSSVRAMKGGAVDFLTKPIEEADLFAAVRRAVAMDDDGRRTRAAQAALTQRLSRLTPREHQVLALVVTGMLNKQIAGQLGTSERTIKVHRARVMQKMEATSVADLVRIADRLGVSGLRAAV
ncbi:MAG TPA: response regulator [Gemmatimonadales bacterium]|nr:response regulator [Gemmatimonadales bacterium]